MSILSEPTVGSRNKASVVIPVKNGGALFKKVLTAVVEQETSWPFEVLVIDSGSRDDSVAFARALGVRVEEIEPSSFGHGRTRNLGASMTDGACIVFITHDALPVDRHWLSRLVSACELAPDVAGAFGRHLAYPTANPVTKRELAGHFAQFGEQPCAFRLEDRTRYDTEEGYRQFLHFFSNNNACLRRSVWEHTPFPDVDFAEDQTWAQQIVEAGFAKAYAPDACVYHSHDFGVLDTMRRSFDESRAFKRFFGYHLCPSLYGAMRSWLGLTRRDAKWLLEDVPGFWQRVRYLSPMPFRNFARMIGQYLGGRQGSLPNWVVKLISRDKLIQRG